MRAWILQRAWRQAACAMCVCLVARAGQVTGVSAVHRAGQTFVTFREVGAAPQALSARELHALRRARGGEDGIRYRVYYAPRPVTSLAGLTPIAEVPPLSGWNGEYWGDAQAEKSVTRYVIEDGAGPLAPGMGLFVHNPERAGEAFYAVTAVTGGVENTALNDGCAMRAPVLETVGQGTPVLQRVERPREWQYVRDPTLHYFVRWESPPNCAVQGKPIDYVVGVPPGVTWPAGVGLHLHCWGGSLDGGYGWWYRAEEGHVLIASNQAPYDWWTGYHEAYWLDAWRRAPRDEAVWRKGVVRPYAQTRLLSFLDWAATRWRLDVTRAHVAGNSMGGSGAVMFAIRHPDRLAWATAWVGVHIPRRSPQFAGSYAQVYGEPDWGVKFENGVPVWEHFDDAAYLRAHRAAGIGLICFSNGKNDAAIGWPQAAEFYRALQETRQPHVFVWGQSGHGQRALLPVSLSDRHMPMDLRTDASLPAFTRCSLDGDPGNGDPADGDPEGQSNLYLAWRTDNIVDQVDRWEMTVYLVERAPRDDCTVDVTPRRLQRFKTAAGTRVSLRVVPVGSADGQEQSAVADADGLITFSNVRVTKTGTRLVARSAR